MSDALARAVLEALDEDALDALAERLAPRIAARLAGPREDGGDRWMTTAQAAGYIGVHRDTVRKLAAARAIPAEQDAPGCKLYFRRVDLDRWREAGGRPAHRARTP